MLKRLSLKTHVNNVPYVNPLQWYTEYSNAYASHKDMQAVTKENTPHDDELVFYASFNII